MDSVQQHRFGGWVFWLIALAPWLRVVDILPGLTAGDPFNLGEAILDISILLIGIAFLTGRSWQPAAILSPTTLSVRPGPFFPSRDIELSEITKINWVSGSTLGLNLRSEGDLSVSLLLIAKPHRDALVEALEKLLSSRPTA
jgi:hypothetical protein